MRRVAVFGHYKVDYTPAGPPPPSRVHEISDASLTHAADSLKPGGRTGFGKSGAAVVKATKDAIKEHSVNESGKKKK